MKTWDPRALGGLVTRPLTLRSFLVILLLVGGLTIATAIIHMETPSQPVEEGAPPVDVEAPPVEGEVPELEFHEIIEGLAWLNYTRFDIDCWYPEGMTLEELGLEGRALSYYEGVLRGYGDPTEPNRAYIHAGEFFLIWKPSGSFDSWKETLDHAIQVTGYGTRMSCSYDESQLQVLSPKLTWQRHRVTSGMLNGTGLYADRWVGTFEAHECTETGRVFVWIYIDFEKYDPISPKYNGMIYLAAYRCHPTEATWIEDLIRECTVEGEPQPVEEEVPELSFHEIIGNLTYDNYTRYDIDYWYPEGMTLKELGNASYFEGVLHGYGEPNESNRAFVHSGEFFLVWKTSGHFGDWEEALDHVIQLTGEGISYDERKCVRGGPSWQGHHYTAGGLSGTGPDADRWVGRFTVQECKETGRLFVYLYLDFEKFDPYDYKYCGAVQFATYSCHPIEGTPIDHFFG